MIVGEIKPLAEIIASISAYRHILVAGCGSCVTVCLSGGEREVAMLIRELRSTSQYKNAAPTFTEDTILRQCELDLIKTYHALPARTDAVLSLACGAGVQTMADAFDPIPVIPALNTTFLGASPEPGVWREMCQGCGDCLLSYTGGICPLARCSKSLMNGPCGGTNGQNCEVDPGIPCAWMQIIQRLSQQKKLHLLTEVRAPKDWRPAGGAGPRIRQRTGISGSPGRKPD